MLAKLLAKFWRARSSLARSEAGNVLMITGLALPVLFGVAGLGIEGAGWYTARRSMQNAADAAVVAAASNASANYLNEARAVTTQYGFTDGSGNTTVTASNGATCPSGGTNCYSVTITKDVPLVFSKIVGFTGGYTVGGASAIRLTTTAIATRSTTTHEYCILALGDGTSTAAVDLVSNGGPNANLAGCSVASNSSMTCNGHDLNADFGDAVGSNNTCGNQQNSGIDPVSDLYSSKASNIPTDPCGGSYPGVTWSGGTRTLAGAHTICGTLTIGADLVLSGSGQIIIYNGNLDLNGSELSTVAANPSTGTAAGAATIIFTGTNSASYSHIIVDGYNGNQGSGLDIAAPTTGTWSGIAIYQDPSLTQNVNMEYGGNEPYFKLTGVVYMPEADVVFSGAINHATSGNNCFILVVETITINGTASILAQGECAAAGVTMPSGFVPGRGQLVD
jgi:Flp pilus assembly protein TadG